MCCVQQSLNEKSETGDEECNNFEGSRESFVSGRSCISFEIPVESDKPSKRRQRRRRRDDEGSMIPKLTSRGKMSNNDRQQHSQLRKDDEESDGSR